MANLEIPGLHERIVALWKLQERAGYRSQTKWAEERGLKQQHFNSWLNGVTPSYEGLVKLAAAFEVPWQWLLLGDEAAKELVEHMRRRPAQPPVVVAPAPAPSPPPKKETASGGARRARARR